MKLIERFRARLHFHEGEATRYRETIALIEQELAPQLQSTVRRKINGALAHHLRTKPTTAAPPRTKPTRPRRTRRKHTGHAHHPHPTGYVKHAVGKMSMTDAILKALGDGPIGQTALAPLVDDLRGTPTNRNSLLVSCAKLAADGQLAQGEGKKGVYALPKHKDRIKEIEAQLSMTGRP